MPSIRARRPSRVRNAVAAGGVVVRQRDGKREVVLAGRHADGTWVFPKGTPDNSVTSPSRRGPPRRWTTHPSGSITSGPSASSDRTRTR